MECAVALGDRMEALRIYQRFAERARRELGTEPAGETTRLYQTLQKTAAASA